MTAKGPSVVNDVGAPRSGSALAFAFVPLPSSFPCIRPPSTQIPSKSRANVCTGMLAVGGRRSPSAFASPGFGSYAQGATWLRRRVSRASLLGFPLTIHPGPSPETNSAPQSGSTADVADTVWMALGSFTMPFGKQKIKRPVCSYMESASHLGPLPPACPSKVETRKLACKCSPGPQHLAV